LRRFLHLLVIFALFLTYQKSVVHSTKHLHAYAQCNLCQITKENQHSTHSTHFVLVDENILQNQYINHRLTYKEPIDLTQKPLIRRSIFEGCIAFVVHPIPLGYFSTAPPYFS